MNPAIAIIALCSIIGTDIVGSESKITDDLIARSDQIYVVELASLEGYIIAMGEVNWSLTGTIDRVLKGGLAKGMKVSVDWQTLDGGAASAEQIRRRPRTGEKFIVFLAPKAEKNTKDASFDLSDPWLGFMPDNAAFDEYIRGKVSPEKLAR